MHCICYAGNKWLHRILARMRNELLRKQVTQPHWSTQMIGTLSRRPATLITVIHLCLALQTSTSLNFSVFRIDWPDLWRSHHHLLAVFHCCIPFTGCKWNLEKFSKSVYWPINHLTKNRFLSAVPACNTTPIPFIKITQGNHSSSYQGLDQHGGQGHFT